MRELSTGIDERLAVLLDRTTYEVPPLPLDERPAPSEILGRPVADATVELWRHTGIDLLAGSHALDAAEDQPWLTHFGGRPGQPTPPAPAARFSTALQRAALRQTLDKTPQSSRATQPVPTSAQCVRFGLSIHLNDENRGMVE